MVIKYFGPNDKRGVYWPPYTAAEQRAREAALYKKPHSGPYVMLHPSPRSAEPATAATTGNSSSRKPRLGGGCGRYGGAIGGLPP
jgi:hypothetical protein